MHPETDRAEESRPDTCQQAFARARRHLADEVLGQQSLVDRLLVTLLADGHMLVEGAPGLAKTRAVKALAGIIEGDYHRIQFTPDLLPSDLTGTDVYQPRETSFEFQPGPLFHNVILADEINRAPAKVQSALLEAMAERQITVGQTTHALPQLFMVMATQNPIEQEGTYPLPEAQLDRFLLHVRVDYPAADVERRILTLARNEAEQQLRPSGADNGGHEIAASQVVAARREVLELYLSESMEEYIVQLVLASRDPSAYDDTLAQWVEYGASPRGSIGLERAARAHAWLHGRDYVSPDDVQKMVHDVLRHRIILSFHAEAEGIDTDRFISRLIQAVPVP